MKDNIAKISTERSATVSATFFLIAFVIGPKGDLYNETKLKFSSHVACETAEKAYHIEHMKLSKDLDSFEICIPDWALKILKEE